MIPKVGRPSNLVERKLTEDICFQNVVALQPHAALVQAHKRAISAIDVVTDDCHHVATVRNIREKPHTIGRAETLQIFNKANSNATERRFESLRIVVNRRCFECAARLQDVALEISPVTAGQLQPEAHLWEKARALLREDHALHALRQRRLIILLEITQNGKQSHQSDEALLTIDDVEFARRHLWRQFFSCRARRVHE